MKDLSELIEEYQNENNLNTNSGRQGVENLCQLVRALGYKDPMYFGTLSARAAIGDLINFLEDNSGAIDTLIEWIGKQNLPEWQEALESELPEEKEEEEEEEEA